MGSPSATALIGFTNEVLPPAGNSTPHLALGLNPHPATPNVVTPTTRHRRERRKRSMENGPSRD
jgi:hypothetical protein